MSPANTAKKVIVSCFEAIYNFVLPKSCNVCYEQGRIVHCMCLRCLRGLNMLSLCKHRCVICMQYEGGRLATCNACTQQNGPLEAIYACFVYKNIAAHVIKSFKYGRRIFWAPFIAKLIYKRYAGVINQCDYIVPVPINKIKLIHRSFNHAASIARAVSKYNKNGPKVMYNALISHRIASQAASSSKVLRVVKSKGAFSVSKGFRRQIAGKTVCIIDDVVTTGATLQEVARLCKKAGAKKVIAITFAATPIQKR